MLLFPSDCVGGMIKKRTSAAKAVKRSAITARLNPCPSFGSLFLILSGAVQIGQPNRWIAAESHICQHRADMGHPSSVRKRDLATGNPGLFGESREKSGLKPSWAPHVRPDDSQALIQKHQGRGYRQMRAFLQNWSVDRVLSKLAKRNKLNLDKTEVQTSLRNSGVLD